MRDMTLGASGRKWVMEVQPEIEEVARAIEAGRSGAISPEESRRVRVIQGIYPIRGGTDRYLLRIRIPLGRPSPSHLRALADAADRFASGYWFYLYLWM